VSVCAPHDQGQGNECIDGGPLFDSTNCEEIRFRPNCGIGFELAFLLLPLSWLRERRGRRGR
jgi:hypothetical protein